MEMIGDHFLHKISLIVQKMQKKILYNFSRGTYVQKLIV
jgi:hypothetical protein